MTRVTFHVLLTDYEKLTFNSLDSFIDWYARLKKGKSIKKIVMTVNKKGLTLEFELI